MTNNEQEQSKRDREVLEIHDFLEKREKELKEKAQSIESKTRIYYLLSEIWYLLDDTSGRLTAYHDDFNNEDALQIENVKNTVRDIMRKYS